MEAFLVKKTNEIFRFLYSWLTTDGVVLGYILGVVHITLCTALGIMIIISHTLYPVFWLQLLVYFFLFIIWLQHLFLQVCILFLAEKTLTNNEPPFYTIVREVLGINIEDFIKYFFIAETAVVASLGLEIISKISVYIHEFYGMKL
jgi:hypothetical protein